MNPQAKSNIAVHWPDGIRGWWQLRRVRRMVRHKFGWGAWPEFKRQVKANYFPRGFIEYTISLEPGRE